MIEVEERTEETTAPSKAWRNWYLPQFTGPYRCRACKAMSAAQEGVALPAHCKVHPSKDVAESRASPSDRYWGYLGAYPEGERP